MPCFNPKSAMKQILLFGIVFLHNLAYSQEVSHPYEKYFYDAEYLLEVNQSYKGWTKLSAEREHVNENKYMFITSSTNTDSILILSYYEGLGGCVFQIRYKDPNKNTLVNSYEIDGRKVGVFSPKSLIYLLRKGSKVTVTEGVSTPHDYNLAGSSRVLSSAAAFYANQPEEKCNADW